MNRRPEIEQNQCVARSLKQAMPQCIADGRRRSPRTGSPIEGRGILLGALNTYLQKGMTI